MTVYIFQKRIAEYRVGVFEALAERIPDLMILTEQAPKGNVAFRWDLLERRKILGFSAIKRRQFSNSDIIISGLNLRDISTILFLLRFRRRWIIWGHGFGRSRIGFWGRVPRILAARLAAASIFYTKGGAIEFSKYVKKDKLFVATNTILLPFYVEPAPETRNSFLYFGDLRKEKGVDLLLRAFEVVASLREDIFLEIVGDGQEKEALMRMAAKMKNGNRVQFFSRTRTPVELKPHLDRAIATVSPQHVGLSVVQSFWAGVPVVTQVNSFHAPEFEYCSSGENCLLFQGGVEGLVGAMNSLLERGQREFLALNAKQYFHEQLSLSSMLSGFCSALRYVEES